MYTSGGRRTRTMLTQHRIAPAGEYEERVPKLRIVSSMVSAPAAPASASSSNNTVTSTDHTKSGIRWSVMPGARMLKDAW